MYSYSFTAQIEMSVNPCWLTQSPYNDGFRRMRVELSNGWSAWDCRVLDHDMYADGIRGFVLLRRLIFHVKYTMLRGVVTDRPTGLAYSQTNANFRAVGSKPFCKHRRAVSKAADYQSEYWTSNVLVELSTKYVRGYISKALAYKPRCGTVHALSRQTTELDGSLSAGPKLKWRGERNSPCAISLARVKCRQPTPLKWSLWRHIPS